MKIRLEQCSNNLVAVGCGEENSGLSTPLTMKEHGAVERLAHPRRFSEPELKRFQVQIIDPYGVVLRCTGCGQVWSPMLRSAGRLPKGYWKCPDGCNHAGFDRGSV